MRENKNTNSMVTLGFRVNPELSTKLALYCKENDVNKSDVLRHIFYQGMNNINAKTHTDEKNETTNCTGQQ